MERFFKGKIWISLSPHLSSVNVEAHIVTRGEQDSFDGGCPSQTLLEYSWLWDHNVIPIYTPVF